MRRHLRSHRDHTHVRCEYCSWCETHATPARALGKCSCGGGRHVHRPDDGSRVDVRCWRCGKVSPRLTARVREELDAVTTAYERRDAHVRTKHRAKQIADQIRDIERSAASLWKHGQLTDDDWQCHELAVEYRALLREWWALPAVTVSDLGHSPSARRTLTGKGLLS